MKIKILEEFYSLQGEGKNVGTPMHFIRLPYCNVQKEQVCTTIDGTLFKCDTCLSNIREIDLDELFGKITCPNICVTGGEPFHPRNEEALNTIYDKIDFEKQELFFETNGTFLIPDRYKSDYISCSPKKGFLFSNIWFINEFRFLIDAKSDPSSIPEILQYDRKVFLSPIWDEDVSKRQANLERAIQLVKHDSLWRLSCQMHKYWYIK
jgi:organic radical activating enzyme